MSSTVVVPSFSTAQVLSFSLYVKFITLPSASFISYPSLSVVTAYSLPSLPIMLSVLPTFSARGFEPDQNSMVLRTSKSAVPHST